MGEVYRARDTRLARDVAVKVLPAALSLDAERIARLEGEARLLATLNHPHIATIHSLEVSNGVCALVMELIEGPTLAEHLAGRALPMNRTLEVARQIADALAAAHARGIVHRDLKPANIKLTGSGAVKILDFGLAQAVGPDDRDAGTPGEASDVPIREDLIAGTPAYMSPEQARGERVDQRADVWAFGCVLYEMLTGSGRSAAPRFRNARCRSGPRADWQGVATDPAGWHPAAAAPMSLTRSEATTASHGRRAN
jgi:serine/threonine protein kinase